MKRKKAEQIIDSKYIKIVSIKKNILKDSIVFICLNEEKFGHLDKATLNKITKDIDNIEPSGVYFQMLKKISLEFYNKAEFANKKLLVTINHQEKDVDIDALEKEIRTAISDAKSIEFVHKNIDITVLP